MGHDRVTWLVSRLRRRTVLARVAALLVVLSLFGPVGASALTYEPSDEDGLQRGTVTSPANGTTVVSVQGFSFRGNTNPKKPPRLVGLGERGRIQWVHESRRGTGAWFFDVDPLPNGNLLVVSPRDGETVVYELNPDTRERIWTERFDYEDTHDVDALGDGRLVIAHMRGWNGTGGYSTDEVVIYNRTTDSVSWRWSFREHYPNATDGGMNRDWTHLNDVDPVGDHRLLLSPRNFDQVIVLNRTTGDIERRLGSDGNHSVLYKQHNPDYLVGENGTPTVLVADSENDRVVEYAYRNGSWTRTWTVGAASLSWPRDADRLPNGNTLIVDTLNHRVIEVTPRGEIVWEYYVTWGPFDAERVAHGDGSQGPTIREQNATGTYNLTGSAGLRAGTGSNLAFHEWVWSTFEGTGLGGPARFFAVKWAHLAPWFRPVWMSSWDAAAFVGGCLVAALWGSAELYARRRRLRSLWRSG